MPKPYEPTEERLQKFRDALKAVCEEHQLWLYFSNEECYDCGSSVVVGRPQIITAQDQQEDLKTLEWYDMEAEIEKAEEDARKAIAYAKLREEYLARTQSLCDKLSAVFCNFGLVLWTGYCPQVRIEAFQEYLWQKIANAEILANPLRCRTLVERAITEEHKQRVPLFLEAVEAVCREEGLIPNADGTPRSHFQAFAISPLYNDPLPGWMVR